MLGIVGVNHNTAPISIREALAFNEEDIRKFIEAFSHGNRKYSLIVLSTCNRTEVYFTTKPQFIQEAGVHIKQYMVDLLGGSDKVRKYFYKIYNIEAIKHLFSVACGLESQVLGEYQIVKQIKDAWCFSASVAEIPTILTRILDKSLETSKKVRTHTDIGRGTNSVSTAAVLQCESFYPNLKEQNVFLIGTGETGHIVAQNFKKKGVKNLTLTNRTISKAKDLAEKYDVNWVEFNQLKDTLAQSDIIIVSTGSKEHLLTGTMVNNAINKRNGKPQLYIDLSVPRNIAEDLSMIKDVTLLNVDELQKIIDDNRKRKKGEVSKAHEIIDKALGEHMVWLDTYHLSPTIKAIRANLQTLNEKELQNFISHNPDSDQETLEKFSELMLEKYTRFLVKNLKSISTIHGNMEYIKMVDQLFEI